MHQDPGPGSYAGVLPHCVHFGGIKAKATAEGEGARRAPLPASWQWRHEHGTCAQPAENSHLQCQALRKRPGETSWLAALVVVRLQPTFQASIIFRLPVHVAGS